MILEILDRFLQFIGSEILEKIIDRVSIWLTKIVSYFLNFCRIIKTDISLPQIAVLHRSSDFLVINKPPDLVINSNDPSQISVQLVLRKQFPDLLNKNLVHEFYFAHRLDYSTSGILCLPLNKKACAAFCSSFESRKCKKIYIALVNGVVEKSLTHINYQIGEDLRFDDTSKKMCISSTEFCRSPRDCKTVMCVVECGHFLNRPVTKVLLMPITGRRHQLRVHCSSIGHPIVGDYTYGTVMDKNLKRMYLHAIRLKVPNEVEELDIETKDPFDEHLLEDWRSYDNPSTDLNTFYELLDNIEL